MAGQIQPYERPELECRGMEPRATVPGGSGVAGVGARPDLRGGVGLKPGLRVWGAEGGIPGVPGGAAGP